MIGTTITNDHSAGMGVTAMTPTATYPATTARSPWARLTTFMTPNMSDSPQANRAYRPPVKIPWMMALTQAIRYLPLLSPGGATPPVTPPLLGGNLSPQTPSAPLRGGCSPLPG